MNSFSFWARVVFTLILASLGFYIGGLLPTTSAETIPDSRLLLAIVGVLIGLLTFAPISAWFVRTSTRMIRKLVTWLASELINQFTRITSRSWPASVFPPTIESNQTIASKLNFSGSIIVDTSSIIDGRLLDVAKTGFLSGILIIPDFVLRELQQVADSSDDIKRARGRRGFDIVNQLKKISGIKVEIWEKEIAGKGVDDKLMRLSKMLGGKILTCDFNLNSVAKISGVTVLNINDLSNALKALPVPGETLQIRLLHPGKDKNQGIGYLADGTMVVVKDSSVFIGHEIRVEVTKILQNPSGRMIFGINKN